MSELRDLLSEIEDANRRLMTKPQIDFLDTLLTVIKTEDKNSVLRLLNDDKNNSILIQMREIQETFKSIMRHLKNGEAARQKFLQTYPRWSKLREDSVERLREIAKDINRNRFKYYISQIVGHSASAVGAGGIIMPAMAFLSTPFTLGLAPSLAIMSVGSTLLSRSRDTKNKNLARKVLEAEEILKKDEETYEELSDWLTRAQELKKALLEVLYIIHNAYVNDMTPINLRNLSPEADKIEKAAEELEKEATLLKEVYENLMNPPAPEAKKRKPQIIVFWDEEREECISEDNDLDLTEIKLLPMFETERECFLVLEVGAETFARIKRRSRIKLGINAFTFVEYLPPVICYRCGACGHKTSFCRDRQVCLRCGGEGHTKLECFYPFYHCISCSKHNEKYGTDFEVTHSCFSVNCRSRKIEIDAIRDITDYGGY